VNARRGILAALAVLLIGGCSADLSDVPLPDGSPDDTYELTARLDSALNLPRNAPVKLGGRVVGTVGEVEAKDYVAVVGLRVATDVRLPVGTRAEVRLTAPVGEAFVALEPPRKPRTEVLLTEGDVLGTELTSTAPDTTDLLTAISTAVTGGSFADMGTLTHEMSTALDGRGDDVQHLLGELDELATTANDNLGTIDAAIDGLDELSATAAQESDSLTTSMTELSPAIDVLVEHEDPALRLMTAVTRMSTDTQRLLDRSGDQIVAQVRDAAAVLARIADSQDSIVPIMTGVSAFGQQLDRATPGDYATFDLTIEGNIALGGDLPILGGVDSPPQLGPFDIAPLPVESIVGSIAHGVGVALEPLLTAQKTGQQTGQKPTAKTTPKDTP
jgi:phospholipid/cholesterol/gamma-HCH transport system substrate-binding protein